MTHNFLDYIDQVVQIIDRKWMILVINDLSSRRDRKTDIIEWIIRIFETYNLFFGWKNGHYQLASEKLKIIKIKHLTIF